ncbi:MAG: hypothetical protein M3N43_14120 [Actinomycetota bacterium]|nr:hypothetical protein [Actinomycetota bacterium]
MPWTVYDYQAGPKGGSLTPLLNHCSSIRVVDESGSGKAGDDVNVQYLHGNHPVPHKFADPRLIPLEVVLRFTNSAGVVTHADGGPGHVFENLAEVKRLLRGQRGLATLQRIAPHYGTQQVDVHSGAPTPSQNRFTFLFPLLAPRPFWRSTTLNSISASPLAVLGDAPVDDAEIVFSAAAASPIFTHTASGATIQYVGTVPAGGVRVFTETGQAQRVSGGADESANVAFNKTYILELDPGVSNAYTISSGTVTVEWRNKSN